MNKEKIKDTLYDIKLFLTPRFWFKLKDNWFDFRMRCQRFKRGYADVDVWCMSTWFTSNIIPMLQQLRDHHWGFPGTEDVPTDEKWCEILDRMIFCFKESIEDEPCEVKNPYQEEYDKRFEDWYSKKDMSKQSLENYVNDHSWKHEKEYWDAERKVAEYKMKMEQEGLELFKKYFRNLWD